jgi:hypothetical protein
MDGHENNPGVDLSLFRLPADAPASCQLCFWRLGVLEQELFEAKIGRRLTVLETAFEAMKADLASVKTYSSYALYLLLANLGGIITLLATRLLKP